MIKVKVCFLIAKKFFISLGVCLVLLGCSQMSSVVGLEVVMNELATLRKKLDAILELQKTILSIIIKEEEPKRDELEAIKSEDELIDEEELFEVLEK